MNKERREQFRAGFGPRRARKNIYKHLNFDEMRCGDGLFPSLLERYEEINIVRVENLDVHQKYSQYQQICL